MSTATALQDDPKVAQRYAKAIFEQADADGKLDVISAELGILKDLFSNTAEMNTFFLNPGIPKHEKETLLTEQFGSKVDSLVFNLLKLMLDNDRLASFESTAQKFWTMLDARNNVGWAEVVTASPLDDALETQVKEQLKSIFNYSTVHLKPSVDPAVLGGIKIILGDKVIDGTYTGQLAEIQQLATTD